MTELNDFLQIRCSTESKVEYFIACDDLDLIPSEALRQHMADVIRRAEEKKRDNRSED